MQQSIRIQQGGLGASVFPIFCQGSGKLAVLATGFFIDEIGIFATCSHVFEEPEVEDPKYFYLPPGERYFSKAIEILEFETYEQFDFALAQVPNWKSTPLPISHEQPQSGDDVTLHGYPGKFIHPPSARVEISALPMRLLHGNTYAEMSSGSRGFMAIVGNRSGPSGMSGGPLVNSRNEAIGVYSHGRDDKQAGFDNGGNMVSVFVRLMDISFRQRKMKDEQPG